MYVFVYLFRYKFSCQIHTFLPQILTNVMHLDVSFDLLIFIRYLKLVVKLLVDSKNVIYLQICY